MSRAIQKTAASHPRTLEDWDIYIKTLSGEDLFSKTLAANTQTFADMLREEGLTMADFQKIVLMFVRQSVAFDVRLPLGGALNLKAMAQTDPVARKGANLSPEMTVQTPSVNVPDDIDQTLDALADID